MSIETEVTQEDYEAFVKHVAVSCSTPSPGNTMAIFGVGLFIGLCVSLTGLGRNVSTLAATVFGVLSGALLMVVIIGGISRTQLRRMKPSDDGYVIGNQKLTLCEEGIRQMSRHHQMLMNWSCVRAVNTTDKHVFVMVDRIGGFILPKRSFSSDEQREQFVNEIKKRSSQVSALTV
jgi:predicted helicase